MKTIKVYVVQRCYPYEGCDVKGVFTDKTKATEFGESLVAEFSCSYEVMEYEIEAGE